MNVTSILIVDDERNLRTTLADILADEGYEIETADSGEKALKLYERRSYDLVLMDVRMPGMDGMEAFRRIRRRKRDAQVIMMSAYSMDHLRRACLDEGAIAFVRKPLDVESLLKLIRGTKEMTVLAVEAEATMTGLVADRVRAEGNRLLIAHAPDEALEVIRQIHSDVVFLDESFCKGERDLCAEIRSASPSSRIVLMTAVRTETQGAPEFLGASSDTVVVKPLRVGEVLGVLARLRAGRAPEPA